MGPTAGEAAAAAPDAPTGCPVAPGATGGWSITPTMMASAPVALSAKGEIGRAHVRTPVTNAHIARRLLLEKKKKNITHNQNLSSYHTTNRSYNNGRTHHYTT